MKYVLLSIIIDISKKQLKSLELYIFLLAQGIGQSPLLFLCLCLDFLSVFNFKFNLSQRAEAEQGCGGVCMGELKIMKINTIIRRSEKGN